MKYVWPAVTVVVTREPWWSFGSIVVQPAVSSLQETCVPLQLPERTYSAVSKDVVPPQVAITALPERAGVH
jgi:hypothetical protein